MDCQAIFEALERHALALGVFGAVNRFEPTSAPVLGSSMLLTLSGGRLDPVLSSGLSSISYRWQIEGRVYRADMIPDETVEPELMTAVVALFTSLAGEYALGGLIRHVDFYGSDGERLSATPGWLQQDETVFRTIDLIIPLIINDVMDTVA